MNFFSKIKFIIPAISCKTSINGIETNISQVKL